MVIRKKKTIPYKFSQKHKDYIKKTASCMYNFAEGAVRAGKTVDHIFAFAHELKNTKDKLHLATGSTTANAKLNIGDCNGFGLQYYFRGQCRWGKYKDNEALFIKGPSTKNKTRIVIFAGGGKADSYKKIRGNSYGMWIATEINLHHDNTIKEAFNRTIAAKKRKIFWDLNPDNPNAPIYKDYIDKYGKKEKEGTLLGGYNYQHFTIDDNITISEERRNEIKSQYDPDSIWYMRDIKGLRCIAEGLIYKRFANDSAVNNCKSFLVNEDLLKNIQEIRLGVDFGGNGSGHSFICTAITYGYRDVIVLSSERWLEGDNCKDIDPDKLGKLFVDFVKRMQIKWGKYGNIDYAYMDSAETVLIRGLRTACEKEGIYLTIRNAIKDTISDRINCTVALMAQGRFYVTEDCESLKQAFNTAVWDPKEIKLVRLDDGSSDIDSLDAFEYTIERNLKDFMEYEF